MYGFAKNHKTYCPLRPVLSAINTPEYALCKWLEIELKPYLKSDWIKNSSFEFVEKLKKYQPLNTDNCVTFDIKSLYNNVPLEETINKVTKVVHIDNPSSIFSRSKMTQTLFKNLLRACSQSIFMFNGTVYQQTNGLSMGSPLSPLLANWFVSQLETELLNKTARPKMYCRYVDDIFCIFQNKEQIHQFDEKLNNMHKDMTFVIQTCQEGKLPYLDTQVAIKTTRL